MQTTLNKHPLGEKQMLRNNIKRGAFITVAVLAVILVGVGFTSLKTVSSGSKGVLMQWGKVSGILDEGLHLLMPFRDSIVIMNTQTQLVTSVDQSCGTFDIQEVYVDIAVNYRLNPLAVDVIYTDLRQDYANRIVRPNVEESIKATTSDFTAEELLQLRESVKSRFKAILTERLLGYNIDVVDVAITNYRFNQQFLDATNDKVIALQEAERAKNDLERIRYEAQQQVIQAEAAANATIATATAEATARVIAAESQAEAIRLVQEQLTQNPEYIQYLTVIGWDGKLPYFLGSDVMPFFQLPTNPTD
jgi:regulator of protease activity HflC (stomatin/prohibitin superfamily)